MRRPGQAVAALLLLCAFALAARHLRLPVRDTLLVSLTQLRSEERMRVAQPQGAVNVNLASVEELCRLPGVGPVIAQRIVEEREHGGFFSYPADLLCVKGIGEKTLSRFRDQICLKQ